VAAVRDFVLPGRETERFERIIEPELDMNRIRPRPSALDRLLDILRWLTPIGREVVRPPRRAVGRELEEAFPSAER